MAGRDPETLDALLGRDLRLDYRSVAGFYEDADLRAEVNSRSTRAPRDIAVSLGVDTLRQAIANRLKTRRGELVPLGHPDYGSRHHELVGEPNVERVRNLIKLYVLQALRREARIEQVLRADVRAEQDPPRSTVRIEITARVTGQATPIDIVVPFDLSGDSP